MRVTHAEDYVTHAVIGASQAKAFQINDSTEFFRILSSSLYSDKMLAVIREILCNAWDAHIEGGCINRPIDVSITNDKLVIRDQGPGMAPDDILRLYTTYGGTSKIANENVTGGFGLGSKAPFAYVDHFEVTSCHAGTKTIYNMSLSSAQVDGKPSVMKILDLPTTETGIQVSLNLKDRHDRDRFERLVRRIAANGEMNVKLNGVTVPVIKFSASPHGFTIVKKEQLGEVSSRIFIRYGHVIYPLELPEHLRSYNEEVKKFLLKIHGEQDGRSYGYRISDPSYAVVLQAKAGSISITPSRESLSMTDHTINSVTELITQFMSIVRSGIDPYCIKYLDQAIEETVKTKKVAALFHPRRVMANPDFFRKLGNNLPSEITNLEHVALYYLAHTNYPSSAGFFARDIDKRLSAMIAAGIGDKGLLNSYRQELRRLTSPKAKSPWFYRKILWPLLRDMEDTTSGAKPGMRIQNLMIVDQAQDRHRTKRRMAIPTKSYEMAQIRWGLPFLRKIVTLSHNRIDVLDIGYTGNDPKVTAKELGAIDGTLLYVVPRNPQKIAEARAFFEKRGYVINDWTPSQKVEPKPKDVVTVGAVPAKPKRNGVPKLSNLIDPETNRLDMDLLYCEDNELTEAPEIAVYVSPNRQSLPDLEMPSRALAPVVRLFGDKIAAVPSQISLNKLADKDIRTDKFEEWVLEQVLEAYKKNKLIRQHYRNYRAPDASVNLNQMALLSVIRRDDKLRRTFNLPTPLAGDALHFVSIYESYSHHELRYNLLLKQIYDLIQTWTASASLKKLLEKLCSRNPLIKSIDAEALAGLMRVGTPEQVDKVRKLLLYTMKG
jgi:hypothetical protein